jgi:hypothetical protein
MGMQHERYNDKADSSHPMSVNRCPLFRFYLLHRTLAAHGRIYELIGQVGRQLCAAFLSPRAAALTRTRHVSPLCCFCSNCPRVPPCVSHSGAFFRCVCRAYHLTSRERLCTDNRCVQIRSQIAQNSLHQNSESFHRKPASAVLQRLNLSAPSTQLPIRTPDPSVCSLLTILTGLPRFIPHP